MSSVKITDTEIEFELGLIRDQFNGKRYGRFSKGDDHIKTLAENVYLIDQFIRENYRMPTYNEIAVLICDAKGADKKLYGGVIRSRIIDLVAIGELVVFNNHLFRQWMIDAIKSRVDSANTFEPSEIPDYEKILKERLQKL